MKRFVVKTIVLIIAAMLNGIAVQAAEETANDFFAIYNKAQLDDFNELKDDYLIAKTALFKAESEAQRSEMYNAVLQSAKEYVDKENKRIDGEIKEILSENESIKQDIANSIFGSWEKLYCYDAKYKVNVSKINDLLKKRDKFTVAGTQRVDYEKVENLSKEVDELSTKYKAASDVAILGDVTSVKYPLGKETAVNSGFGSRIDPITGVGINYHSGLDLRASMDTEVLALFNGTVELADYNSVAGYYVRIDHGNGIKSYYCHLNKILCAVGQKVKQYDCVALSGNSGSRTTGPHLHLALYIDNNAVNPSILFKN